MAIQVIGTCSCCGGAVTVPGVWHGTMPPVPTCSRCGARKENEMPVIKMQPPVRGHLGFTPGPKCPPLKERLRNW